MHASVSTTAVLKQSYNSWHEVLTNSRNLNHHDRRKLIKKFKRSQKRRARAQEENENKNIKEIQEESINSDCDDSTVEVPRPLSCGQFLMTLLDNIKKEDFGKLQHNSLNSTKTVTINDEEKSGMVVDHEAATEPQNQNPKQSSHELENALEFNKEDQLDNLLKQIDIEVKEWDNTTADDGEPPSPPPLNQHISINKTWEVEPEKNLTPCKFYTTVGACRYFDKCKKDHVPVVSSQIILIISMFSTYGFEITERAMRSGGSRGDVQDIGLEYSDENLYDDFETFALEVVPELEKYGTLKQFKVCCNRDVHLRGNVYVEYETVSQATICFQKLNGRFFDGKQLNCRFVNITNWHTAVCGMHSRGQVCPRGYHCNYLHVFPNPKGLRFSGGTDARQSHKNYQHNRGRSTHSYNRNRFGSQSSPYQRHSSTHRSPRRDTTSRKRDKHEKKRKRRSQSMETKERKSKKKSSHRDKKKHGKDKRH